VEAWGCLVSWAEFAPYGLLGGWLGWLDRWFCSVVRLGTVVKPKPTPNTEVLKIGN
jgi:hypothetical protein